MTRSTEILFSFCFVARNHRFKLMEHSLSLKNYLGWKRKNGHTVIFKSKLDLCK